MRERDDEFSQFVAAYPAARRQGGYMTEHAFIHARAKVSFETLMDALAHHMRSEQWQTPRYIPSIRTWLETESWMQRLPEPAAPNRRTPFEQARHEGRKKW